MAYRIWLSTTEAKDALGIVKGFDAGRVASSIEDVSSEINAVINDLQIDPTAITAANGFEADERKIKRAARQGFTNVYTVKTTGSARGAAAGAGDDFAAFLQELRDNPGILKSYSGTAAGVAVARSHTTTQSLDRINTGKRRMIDVSRRPGQWTSW